MEKCRKNIIVLEPSKILYEGLFTSISKLGVDYTFYHSDNLNELEILYSKKEVAVILINPAIVQNKLNEFTKIKKQHPDIFWIGIIYSFYENSILKLFDDTFSITDDISNIIRKINKGYNCNTVNNNGNGYLSERETDVLKWLAQGLSNKEIADKLFLSIRTIETHRYNIKKKLNINSIAGLTKYAIDEGILK